MKYLLIVGNISFDGFTEEDLALFKSDKEQKAMVHEIQSVLLFDDIDRAYEMADDAESYVLFPNFKGELVFETEELRREALKEISSLLPIEFIFNFSYELGMALQRTYVIPVIYQSVMNMTVNANNLQEAVEIALKEFFKIPDDNYLQDSAELDGILEDNYPDEEYNFDDAMQKL